jgi:hypothetical protein
MSECRGCPHEPHKHTWVRIFTEDGQHVVRIECSGCQMTPYEVLLKRYVRKREAPV